MCLVICCYRHCRFCVSVRRLKFPPDAPLKVGQSDIGSLFPGHIITIAPPVVLESLLPMDMHYRILQPNSVAITGTVKPGKKACLVTVSSSFLASQLCVGEDEIPAVLCTLATLDEHETVHQHLSALL